MSNAWYHYVGPLGVSAAFVVVGIISVCLYWFGGRTADGKRRFGPMTALCGAVFGFGLGGTMGFTLLLSSPTPWEREELFDQVFRTSPECIERYIIRAGDANQYRPLTNTDVVIDDPTRIRRIAEILRTAPEVSPNHPRANWTANVEMVTRDGTYYFGVYATVRGDSNGTLVSPWSSERGGWNLGSVRADGLDEVLEDAVNKAEMPN